MDISKIKFKSVDEYLSAVPKNVSDKLQELRTVIKQAAPQATEVISYNMPAYKQNGVLVYFAACKEHVGFYPTNGPITAFKDQLSAYKTTKGSIHFPYQEAVPEELVKKIVQFRMEEDKAWAEKKKDKKK